MLATSGRPSGGRYGWVVEPKLDGSRSIVTVTRGCLDVRTRNGRNITDCVPELEPLTAGPDLVLDGELIVGAGRLSDFYRLGGRLAGKPRAGSETVIYVAFHRVRVPLRPPRSGHRRVGGGAGAGRVALDRHRARRPPRCAHQERAEHHQLRSRARTPHRWTRPRAGRGAHRRRRPPPTSTGSAAASPTDRRMGSEPVIFVAFHLLWLNGNGATARPYSDRSARLEPLDLHPMQIVPSTTQALSGWKASSSSRSADWRKVRCDG